MNTQIVAKKQVSWIWITLLSGIAWQSIVKFNVIMLVDKNYGYEFGPGSGEIVFFAMIMAFNSLFVVIGITTIKLSISRVLVMLSPLLGLVFYYFMVKRG